MQVYHIRLKTSALITPNRLFSVVVQAWAFQHAERPQAIQLIATVI